jgi:acetylornithine aminotransferase
MERIIWSLGHQIKYNNIISSDNCFLYDTLGNRLIDLESGVWCTCVGHNNKNVNKVISDQINKITHSGFCYCHPQLEVTAQKVLDITGLANGKCEFLCSGSEAVEYGLRISRAISIKPLVLTFSESYFGAYGDASSRNEEKWFIFDRLNCSCNNSNGCTGDCKDFEKIPFEKINTFLFEPGSSSGLVRFPSQKLIQKIINRIKENNGIVMVNEVTTGIGRTGKWFGYQHYNLLPDIVAIGKGIGNGYPVSLTVISKNVAEKLAISDFKYSQSHQNDPLGAFVAYEVIRIITEDDLLEKCVEKGNYLKNRISGLINDGTIIKEFRGRGLMIAIELKKNAQWVYDELLKKGFIVAKRPNAEVLRLDPALTIETDSLDLFIDALKNLVNLN